MKIALALSLLFAASVSLAKATLQIPVVLMDGDEKTLSIAELNKKLAKIGADPIPTSYVVSTSDKKPHEVAAKLDGLVEDAFKKLGPSAENYARRMYGTPGEHDTRLNFTCYTGSPEEAVGLISALGDSEYSDQLSIHGWKYKKEVHIDSQEPDETDKWLSKESKLWKQWRGTGEAFLILTAIGDSGDDVNEGLIARCPSRR